MPRIIIVDDHPLIRAMLEASLRQTPDLIPVATLPHTTALLPTLRKTPADLIILDLAMPGQATPPADLIREINRLTPHIKILILSALTEGPIVASVLRTGVHGYLLKTDLRTLNLPVIIRAILAGSAIFSEELEQLAFLQARDYTETELAVIRLAAQGFDNAQIATTLHLAEKTVRNAAHTLYQKLNVSGDPTINPRTAALLRARTLGLLD